MNFVPAQSGVGNLSQNGPKLRCISRYETLSKFFTGSSNVSGRFVQEMARNGGNCGRVGGGGLSKSVHQS